MTALPLPGEARPADAILTTIEQTERPSLTHHVKAALRAALSGQTRLDPAVLQLPGMSGRLYRIFINHLIGLLDTDARYLEVGVWQGSTLCSAICGNPAQAVAIDNWSQFGGPRDAFQRNLERFGGRDRVRIVEDDFRRVNYAALGLFNVFLFDGPHHEADQYEGIVLAQPALERHHVLVVDDWNLKPVREGTHRALAALPLEIHYMAEIRTTLDDTHPRHHSTQSDWHDGYMFAVLEKR